MKVSDLQGALLDYWTGRADNIPAEELKIQLVPRTTDYICVRRGLVRYDPSSSPTYSWPIIELELDGVYRTTYDGRPEYAWTARTFAGFEHRGPTLLIAACRAKVASVFGNEVPDEV